MFKYPTLKLDNTAFFYTLRPSLEQDISTHSLRGLKNIKVTHLDAMRFAEKHHFEVCTRHEREVILELFFTAVLAIDSVRPDNNVEVGAKIETSVKVQGQVAGFHETTGQVYLEPVDIKL